MLKAIIFDLDNTLIDFMRMKRVSCEKAVKAMKLDISDEKALKDIYKLYSKTNMEDHEIFDKFLMKHYGHIDYAKLGRAIVAYRKAREENLHAYPNVKKTLLNLKKKGMKLVLITDAPRIKAWVRLARMGLEDMFDVVITLDDSGKKKPSKHPFRIALDKLNVKPYECLMVGDSPSRDINGAKGLGMKTCFARYGYIGKKKDVKADYYINSFKDLVSMTKLSQ